MADAAFLVLTPDTHSMPLLAHLEELRKRIIFSVLGVLGGFLACWSYADRIFGLMQQPIIEALRHHGIEGGLVYLNPIATLCRTDCRTSQLWTAWLCDIGFSAGAELVPFRF